MKAMKATIAAAMAMAMLPTGAAVPASDAVIGGRTNPGADSRIGRVYIPDMGRSLSSRMHRSSAAAQSSSGSMVNGFLCESQVWHRVA